YAITRVFVVRTDSGKWDLNYSEWLGNGTTVALSNLYYPVETRNVTDNVQKLGLQIGTECFFPGAKGVLAGLEAEILQEENLTTRAMLRAYFATIPFDECLSTERRICPPSARSRHGGIPRSLPACEAGPGRVLGRYR